jgi:hypothetical protein
MRSLVKKAAFISLICGISLQSMAWGVLGHRIVGQIAESHLTLKTKSEIKKILGNESVAMSSNWMDFVKSDNSFRYLGKWHYLNLSPGLTFSQVSSLLKKDTGTNINTKINFVVKELKKKETPLEKKRMYLRILVHLVGDIHQPLHCGRAEDSGGTGIKVKWFNKRVSLHSLWDSELIEFQQLSYTEYASAIDFPTTNEINAWQKDDLSKWVFESYQLSNELYKEAETDSSYGYKYNFNHVATLNQQLLKAGVRLAGQLNKIFAD